MAETTTPAVEPRTEAGKRLLTETFTFEDEYQYEAALEGVLAIEAEAATPPADDTLLRRALEELLDAAEFRAEDMSDWSKEQVERFWLDKDSRWMKAQRNAYAALRAEPEARGLDRSQVPEFAKRLFAEIPTCTGCDFDHGWDDHVIGIHDAFLDAAHKPATEPTEEQPR